MYLVAAAEQAIQLADPGLPALGRVGHVIERGGPGVQNRTLQERRQLSRPCQALLVIVLPAEGEGKVQPLLKVLGQGLHMNFASAKHNCHASLSSLQRAVADPQRSYLRISTNL